MKMSKILGPVLLAALLSAGNPAPPDAQALLNQALEKVSALKDCSVQYRDDDTFGTGKDQLRAHYFFEGKYINHPRIYYQQILESGFNFEDQSTPGFQEMYREDTDMIYVLPKAYRALGVISLFPEDPKSFGMRGINTKNSGPWDFVGQVAAMARIGKVSVSAAKLGERNCLKFEVTQNPGTFYYAGINRIWLWVDEKSFLPARIEKFAPGEEKPVVITAYDFFSANVGLDPKEMKFTGLKNPFSLIKSPSGAEIEPLLKPAQRTRLPEAAPDPKTALASFNAAVDKIKNYRTDLTMGLRYHRLRLYREDRFAYSKNPYWFTLFTTVQEANYLLLSHSAGSLLWYDPSDRSLRLVGGGVQKVMGEQIFSGNDYKFSDQMGDNPYQMNFPDLQKLIAENFANDRAQSALVQYQGKKMWELQLVRARETPMLQPGKIVLVLDPETALPAALELSGYDDPHGLIAYTFKNLKINQPLKPGEKEF